MRLQINSGMSTAANEAHVWFARPENHSSRSLLLAYRELLSTEEGVRLERLRFSTDKHHYLLGHALVRLALSAYGGLPPKEWRFSRNEFGRPEIIGQDSPTPLRFNYARTNGLVACLIVKSIDAGIDVENTVREIDFIEVASGVFHRHEVSFLRSLPKHKLAHGFYTLWTLKEAYVKALGTGLSLPLDRFFFSLANPAIPQICCPEEVGGESQMWQFTTLSPTPSHTLSVALKCGHHGRIKVTAREFGSHMAHLEGGQAPGDISDNKPGN